jgi:serine/threonine protein kinase
MAPELFDPESGQTVTRATDVYAFGMTVLEVNLDYELFAYSSNTFQIYTLRPPFPDLRTEAQVILAVIRGIRPARPNDDPIDNYLWMVITRCWDATSSTRPRMREVAQTIIARDILCEYQKSRNLES